MHPLPSAVYLSAPKNKLVRKEKIKSTIHGKHWSTPGTHRLYRVHQALELYLFISYQISSMMCIVMKSPITKASSFLRNKILYESDPMSEYVFLNNYSWIYNQNKLTKIILWLLNTDSWILLLFTLQPWCQLTQADTITKGLRKNYIA